MNYFFFSHAFEHSIVTPESLGCSSKDGNVLSPSLQIEQRLAQAGFMPRGHNTHCSLSKKLL